jgi:hypothetical protein
LENGYGSFAILGFRHVGKISPINLINISFSDYLAEFLTEEFIE